MRCTSERVWGVAGAVLFVAVSSSIAAANDSSFGGQGADLTPISEDRIRMVSERIEISQRPDRAAGTVGNGHSWRVRATYRFHNTSDERVSLQIGFPESPCIPDESDCNGRTGRFRGMRTTIRGEAATHRFGEVRRQPAWPRLGRVFLYDVVFAPGEELEIVHRYSHDRSFSAAFGETLTYITRTGALWNGPIGDARFIVRVPYIPRQIFAHRDYPGERLLIRRDGVPKAIELRFRSTDFRPTHDLSLIIAGDAGFETDTPGVAPPDLASVSCPGNPSRAAGLPAATLELCAAAVEAAYGGPLSAATADAMRNTIGIEEAGEAFAVVLPHAHPEYDISWLSERDRAYVTALRAAIAEGDEAATATTTTTTTPNTTAHTTTAPAPQTPTPQPASTASTTTAASDDEDRGGACSASRGPIPGNALSLALLAAVVALRMRRSS